MDQVKIGKDLVVPSTGEVIESYGRIVDRVMPNRTEFIETIFADGSKKPMHLQIAENFSIPPHVVQSYCGVIPVPASSVKDEVLEVVGFVPWFSGVFMSKKTNEQERGYYKVLFKTTKKNVRRIIVNDEVKKIEQSVIVSTGGKRVATFFAQLGEMYGFYDWPDGISVRIVINKDPDTNEEEVIPVPEDF